MTHWTEKIGINVLLLDEKNPRYPQVKDQDDAFDQMIKRNESKIRSIARHISEYGLNPSTIPIVFLNSDGKYIVKDGNRRITAVKAMMYPNKVKNDPSLKKYVEKLNIKREYYKFIECTVFDDEAEADRWIRINHQGSQEGIGQDGWSPISKVRDRYNMGEAQPALALFDYLQEKLPRPVDESNFPFSTFERIVNNSIFKERLGIHVDDGHIKSTMSEGSFIDNFQEIFKDMASSKDSDDYLDSRTINDEKSVKVYIQKKEKEGFLIPLDSNPLPVPEVDIETKPSERDSDSGGKKKKRGRKLKETLISKECDIRFPKKRIQNIFESLKDHDLNKHPDSVSLVFRGFLEMCAKYYYDEVMDQHRTVEFNKKLLEIAEHLKKNNLITDDQFKAMRIVVTAPNDKSINIGMEFNQFGHNYDFYPTPESLKRTWDSLEPLFRAMFLDGSESEEQ